MKFAYSLSQALPLVKKYQTDATIIEGVPALIDTGGEAGLNAATTGSLADMVGVTLEGATYSVTQGDGGLR